ncbi:hypothetical protein ACOSP7_002900 [Xanthoceras sorbifolium]
MVITDLMVIQLFLFMLLFGCVIICKEIHVDYQHYRGFQILIKFNPFCVSPRLVLLVFRVSVHLKILFLIIVNASTICLNFMFLLICTDIVSNDCNGHLVLP